VIADEGFGLRNAPKVSRDWRKYMNKPVFSRLRYFSLTIIASTPNYRLQLSAISPCYVKENAGEIWRDEVRAFRAKESA